MNPKGYNKLGFRRVGKRLVWERWNDQPPYGSSTVFHPTVWSIGFDLFRWKAYDLDKRELDIHLGPFSFHATHWLKGPMADE